MLRKSNDKLKKYLDLIQTNFDVKDIVKEKKDTEQIKKYYLASRNAYLIFHNSDGFIHMGLSSDKKYKTEDVKGQIHTVNSYIKSHITKNILELGAGNGANSAYLAKMHPAIHFEAIDLSTNALKKYATITNFRQTLGDFHNLNRYEDNFFDIVFAIETVCHSNDKAKILSQVYRKLKKGGLFIIFDGYSYRTDNELSDEEKLAKVVTGKAMAVDVLENIRSFEEKIHNSKFTILDEKDLSEEIMPNLQRLERLAYIFYIFLPFISLLKIFLSSDMLKNSIAGLLMPVIVERKILCYYLHVLEK